MPQAQTMSLDDKLSLRMKVFELEEQGKLEEAQKLERSIPLSPYLAKWAKKRLGAEFLIENGWNLSDAEAQYGPDWLSK